MNFPAKSRSKIGATMIAMTMNNEVIMSQPGEKKSFKRWLASQLSDKEAGEIMALKPIGYFTTGGLILWKSKACHADVTVQDVQTFIDAIAEAGEHVQKIGLGLANPDDEMIPKFWLPLVDFGR